MVQDIWIVNKFDLLIVFHIICWFYFLFSQVNDIHAVLEVTVLDEDKNKVYEFLGRIEIPILTVKNI